MNKYCKQFIMERRMNGIEQINIENDIKCKGKQLDWQYLLLVKNFVLTNFVISE